LSDATTPIALGIGQRSDRVVIEKKHRETRRDVTLVKITASAVSLNVDDVAASVRFLTGHFGFTEEMSADGFASLGRPDAGMNVVFLRRGLETLPADQRDDHAGGLILAFEVDDLEGELARLRAEGVAITMPLRSEEWGERAFQVRDPNGVVIELLDWKAADG
jgi:catechol 2,3-dioxygenase-like lactoylglutathione lyase family enzyme